MQEAHHNLINMPVPKNVELKELEKSLVRQQ